MTGWQGYGNSHGRKFKDWRKPVANDAHDNEQTDREMLSKFQEQELAEILSVVEDIMKVVTDGTLLRLAEQVRIRAEIVKVLAGHARAANDRYAEALEAERAHRAPPPEDTYQFPAHPISQCSPDFCGRYAGQRRDAARPVAPLATVCPARVWPYTENNACVLDKGHAEEFHKDRRGRLFNDVEYVKAIEEEGV